MNNAVQYDRELIKRKDLMSMLKIKSVNTYYKLTKNQGFPKGIKLSGGLTVYFKDEVLKYLENVQKGVN